MEHDQQYIHTTSEIPLSESIAFLSFFIPQYDKSSLRSVGAKLAISCITLISFKCILSDWKHQPNHSQVDLVELVNENHK